MVKVLIEVAKDETALQYFRQILPHWTMLKKNQIEVIKTQAAYGTDLTGFQCVQILRIASYKGKTQEYYDKYRKAGLKILFDIDDYWHLDRSHPMYKTYQENDIPKQTEEAMRGADWVTTTTPYLADKIKDFNKNVTILENAIDPTEKQWSTKPIESDRARFGWIGGVFHRKDIELMTDSFKRVSLDYNLRKKIQVCSTFSSGQEYASIERTFTNDFKLCTPTYRDRLKKYIKEDIADEPYRRLWGKDVYNYATLYDQIDCALIPLDDTPFNRCKSELKMIEAGFKKKACIVSQVKPYDLIINDNCLLVKPGRDFIDWYVHMRKLAENPNRIRDLGEQLYEDVKDKYNINTVNKKRLQLYERLCE